jgi:hypothetical protein
MTVFFILTTLYLFLNYFSSFQILISFVKKRIAIFSIIIINITVTVLFFNSFFYIHDEYASLIEFSAAHFQADRFSNPANLYYNYNSAITFFNFFGLLAKPFYFLKPAIYKFYPGVINYILLLITGFLIYEILNRFFKSNYFSITTVFLILFNPIIHKMARTEEIFVLQVFMITLYIFLFHLIFLQKRKSKLLFTLFIITILLSSTIGPMYVIFNSILVIFLLFTFKQNFKEFIFTKNIPDRIIIGVLCLFSIFYYIENIIYFIYQNSANYGFADKLPTFLKIFLKYYKFLKTDPQLFPSIDWHFFLENLFLSQIKSNLVYFSKFNPLYLQIAFVISILFLIINKKIKPLFFWIFFLGLLTSFYFYWNIPKTVDININVIQRAIPELIFFNCLSVFFITTIPSKYQLKISTLLMILSFTSFFTYNSFLNQKTGEQIALEFLSDTISQNAGHNIKNRYIILIPYSNQYDSYSNINSYEKKVFFNYVNQNYRYDNFNRRLGQLIKLYDQNAQVTFVDITKNNIIHDFERIYNLYSGSETIYFISDLSYFIEGADDIVLFNTKPVNIIVKPSPLKEALSMILNHYKKNFKLVDQKKILPYSAYIYKNSQEIIIAIYHFKLGN